MIHCWRRLIVSQGWRVLHLRLHLRRHPTECLREYTVCSILIHTSHQTPEQYIDNVINNGTAQYANAYFDINYIRAFAVNSSAVVDASGSVVTSGAGAPTATGSNGASPSSSGSSGATTGGGSNGANTSHPQVWLAAGAGVVALLSWMAL